MEVVNAYAKNPVVKSRNMTKETLDLIVELRTASGEELVCKLLDMHSVTSASLMSHDGEVTF